LANKADNTAQATKRAMAHHKAAIAIKRSRRELPLGVMARFVAWFIASVIGHRRAIAQAAHGFDQVGPDFAAQPADKNFHGIRILVEILFVQMFNQFRARNDLARMMHQI